MSAGLLLVGGVATFVMFVLYLLKVFTDRLVICVILGSTSVMGLTVVLLYILILGLKLNRFFEIHRDLLLQLRIDHSSSDSKSLIKQRGLILKRLQVDEKLRPVKLLGIPVTPVLVAQLASGIVSFGGLVVNNFVNFAG